jgi:hypothetical protein
VNIGSSCAPYVHQSLMCTIYVSFQQSRRFHQRVVYSGQLHDGAAEGSISSHVETTLNPSQIGHHKGLRYSLLALPLGGASETRLWEYLAGYHKWTVDHLFHSSASQWHPRRVHQPSKGIAAGRFSLPNAFHNSHGYA